MKLAYLVADFIFICVCLYYGFYEGATTGVIMGFIVAAS